MRKRTKFKTSVTTALGTLLMAMPVYAGQSGQPAIVTGTMSLISAVTAIVAAGVAAVTVAIAMINGLKMQTAEEEEKPKYKKAMKNTIIIGIVIATISGTVSWIFHFYGV